MAARQPVPNHQLRNRRRASASAAAAAAAPTTTHLLIVQQEPRALLLCMLEVEPRVHRVAGHQHQVAQLQGRARADREGNTRDEHWRRGAPEGDGPEATRSAANLLLPRPPVCSIPASSNPVSPRPLHVGQGTAKAHAEGRRALHAAPQPAPASGWASRRRWRHWCAGWRRCPPTAAGGGQRGVVGVRLAGGSGGVGGGWRQRRRSSKAAPRTWKTSTNTQAIVRKMSPVGGGDGFEYFLRASSSGVERRRGSASVWPPALKCDGSILKAWAARKSAQARRGQSGRRAQAMLASGQLPKRLPETSKNA